MLRQSERKRALFLDRDGVINVNHGYVCKIENFDWIEGIFDLVKRANAANMYVLVIKNQSGIGRGYYKESDFTDLSDWMTEQFKQQGAVIHKVYWCPHHPTKAQAQYRTDCNCRKPKIGMVEQALSDFNIDLAKSIMVGDKNSDMQLAENAGIGTAFHIRASAASKEQRVTSSETTIHCINHLDKVVV